MAGDWVKWQKGLYRKPEIRQTAKMLSVSIAEACLLWMTFWEWADEVTLDGSIPGVDKSDVDDIVHRDGFGECGKDVGWMIFDDAGLVIPNFPRHNGKPAKKRAIEAERLRLYRERTKGAQ